MQTEKQAMDIDGAPRQILLVEDDAIVRDLYTAILLGAGFETETAGSLHELHEKVGRTRFDVILLDLGLPDGNGLDVVSRIRRETSAGIIITTMGRDHKDRLAGLENGADEYLEKPVHPRELIARVNNLIGRLRVVPSETATVHRFEGWTVDLIGRKVQFTAGGEASLTANEFHLLETLIRHAGKPVHRDSLLASLGDDEEITSRAIDKAIYRMRLKLHAVLGTAAPLIETVHGFGYRFIAKRL